MPPELLNVLIQIPIVAAFIWFTLEMSKRNQAAMDKRDEQWQVFLAEQREQNKDVLQELIQHIEKIDNTLAIHDSKTDTAIATMRERTRPRGAPGTGPLGGEPR